MISNIFNVLLTLKNHPIRWRTLYLQWMSQEIPTIVYVQMCVCVCVRARAQSGAHVFVLKIWK